MFKKNLLLLLFMVAFTTACSDKDKVSEPSIDKPVIDSLPEPDPVPDLEPEPEKPIFHPVDFEYITLNHSGATQGANMTDISYIKKDGTVIPTYFSDVNRRKLGLEPRSATQIEDKLFITVGYYFGDNKIEIVNPNTFMLERTIDFGGDILTYDTEHIKGDMTMVVGHAMEIKSPYNVIIGDIKAEEFVQSKRSEERRVGKEC